MVWEVVGKERAKAITTYTKLKLYYSHTSNYPSYTLHAHVRKGAAHGAARAEKANYLPSKQRDWRANRVAKYQTVQVDWIAVTIGS